MSTHPLVIPPPPDISPISSLLTTNDPPEPHEEAIAHQIIDSSKARILKCDELIKTLNTPTGQLNEVLASLKSRRAEYVSYAQLHRNVVGNIRRLPSDILLEIFFDIVTDRWRHGIWRVIEVCRRWREIALATPTLWSTYIYDATPFLHALSRLSRSLKYSQSLPIRLCISSYCYHVRDLVFAQSKRVTHLDIVFPDELRLTYFSPSNAGLLQWDLLRSLKLHGFWTSSYQASPNTVFQHSPLLQDVEVTTKHRVVLNDTNELVLPWSGLRKFSGKILSLCHALSILQAAPILEECDFTLSQHPHPNLPPPFSHRSLSRLHIDSPEPGEQITQNFFSCLILPSLKKLSVGIFVLDLGIISDFIKRSSCRLTFLCLPNAYDPPNYPASAVHHLLSLVPDVVDLCLPFSAVFLWTTLTSMPSLVPQLRHLYLAGESGDPTAAEQAIREMTVAVAKGDLPTLETLILRSWGLPLSEMIYPSSNETIYEKLLDQWLDKLWKVLIFLHPAYQSDGQIVDVDYLNHTLSLIESRQDIPPLYLCQGYGEEAIPRVKQILERLPDDLFTHRERLSKILSRWSACTSDFLTSVGWMENEAGEFFVYGQRQGSVRVELDGPREVNRFASFAFAEDGRIVV